MAINDCAERFMPEAPRKSLVSSVYMDDIMLGSDSPDDPIEKVVQEVDTGLNKGNFQVKEWVKTHDKKSIKFLSYTYHAQTDTFSVIPRINWSPKKRGVRKSGNRTLGRGCSFLE
jgi:hypothetical protein